MEIREEDLRIDLFRRIDREQSAVRITHMPTGSMVYADEGASLDANRELAVARLTEALGGDA